MTAYQRLRFSRGLHWQTNTPPLPWRSIAITVACVLTYGLVAHVDELGNRAALMEQAAEAEGRQAQVLRDCERGASGYYYPTSGKTFECSKPL
jgi:hypothetical protein